MEYNLEGLGYKLKVEDFNGYLYYNKEQKVYLKIDTTLNTITKADSSDQLLELTEEEIEFANENSLEIEEN
jgi:hypothetical protein